MKKISVAEQRLFDYPKYNSEIARRKAELLFKEPDINSTIRSGKVSNVIENEYILFENDAYIRNRTFWKSCIEKVLNEIDVKDRKLIEDRYFKNMYSYRDLAKKYNYSLSSVSRICSYVCRKLEYELGE